LSQVQVLDACSMIALLWGEPGGQVVESLLKNSAVSCYAHSINLCEVYYQVLRRSDELTARQAIADLRVCGLIERTDIHETFWQKVAAMKARARISLADCFCLVLAIDLSGQVVTSDHGEFDPLVPVGLCPILFIR
jgi:PIN domain nuclease of toxin-antitoxin system